MLQTFKNAWKVQELRKKILFTLMIILLYRIGAVLFVPFVDVAQVDSISSHYTGNIFQFVSLLSGEAFGKGTFFALSVSPYITASIVMQLLTIAIPKLERISKDGEEGKKKIASYTRWCTVILSVLTAYGYVELLNSYGALVISKSTGGAFYYFQLAVMVLCLCAGASLVMWLAEKINDHGIGNGISIILFANIISSAASHVESMVGMLKTNVPINLGGTIVYATNWATGWDLVFGIVKIVLSIVVALAAIVLIIWFTNSERRIPIQYAKRVVGRKMYGGQSSNLPLKMNMAGVMPVIFASSIVSLPATIASFFPNTGFGNFVNKWFGYTSIIYIALFLVLIFAFSYFYIMISFNPVEVANNIRGNGGSIPGIRPGKPTSDYIKKVLNRITLVGAVFLGVIAGVPMIANAVFTAINFNFTTIAFTGTSLLIVVGVALETVRELEAQLSMRNYKGFLD
jgi:preprotein translocase subunit SecY